MNCECPKTEGKEEYKGTRGDSQARGGCPASDLWSWFHRLYMLKAMLHIYKYISCILSQQSCFKEAPDLRATKRSLQQNKMAQLLQSEMLQFLKQNGQSLTFLILLCRDWIVLGKQLSPAPIEAGTHTGHFFLTPWERNH